jgi:hypothetical protein
MDTLVSERGKQQEREWRKIRDKEEKRWRCEDGDNIEHITLK